MAQTKRIKVTGRTRGRVRCPTCGKWAVLASLEAHKRCEWSRLDSYRHEWDEEVVGGFMLRVTGVIQCNVKVPREISHD